MWPRAERLFDIHVLITSPPPPTPLTAAMPLRDLYKLATPGPRYVRPLTTPVERMQVMQTKISAPSPPRALGVRPCEPDI